MKKTISILLALVIMLSLCACGKSEEVKKAESEIATLSAGSDYEEINRVFEQYRALSEKDRKKVGNVNVLAEYCATGYTEARFVLTDAMIAQIKTDIDTSTNASEWDLPR